MSWEGVRTHYRERARMAVALLGMVVALGAVLRVVLYAVFHDGRFSPPTLGLALGAGVAYDTLVGVLVLAPLALALALLRLRVLAFRPVRFVALAALSAGLVFGAFVEFFFFEEFNARYNHIALDYLLHPHEVFGNIWESYNVPAFVIAAAAVGLLAAAAVMRVTREARFERLPWSARWRAALVVVAVAGVSAFGLEAMPSEVSVDRITSEIAENGVVTLVHAFRTAALPFDLYYRTLPPDAALARSAEVLGFPPPAAAPASAPSRLLRPAGAHASGPGRPWDVAILVEESLGSEFIGVLGHADRKASPGFDRWSREGILLTNLTANGNRTVRGLEGVLASFVPLPGDSILKRIHKAPVATLGSVFRDAGYHTTFIYGGWGTFDSMKPFFLAHGYDEFLERDSFPSDAFHTIWGVADEYAYDLLLDRQIAAQRAGTRMLGTVMSVSNHKPYDVPERGTAWPASRRCRESAVAYSDWAIANYLDKAKAAGVLDHTIVLVVGDHGARVYGAEEIPAASYRIPALFLVPGGEQAGTRLERVASQIDLAPTLLALMDFEPAVPFLGESLLGKPAEGGRAFLNHNRDFGILTDTALVTLGLRKTSTCYRREGPAGDAFTRVPSCDADPELVKLRDDATAVFQTADRILGEGIYNAPRDRS